MNAVNDTVVYPGCQLADDFDTAGWPAGKSELWLEPKLDGYRLNAMVHDGKVEFTCRGPGVIPWGANLGHIAQDLLMLGFKNCMVDGEVMAQDWNKTGIIRSKNPGPETLELIRKTVFMHVFDYLELGPDQAHRLTRQKLPRARLESVVYNVPFRERRAELESFDPFGSVQLVPVTIVRSPSDVEAKMRLLMAEGFEGGMVKDPDAPYWMGRTNAWLKAKPYVTREAKVVGFLEGGGKYVGKLGALVVEQVDGVRVQLGTGISDEERADWWQNQTQILGRICEFKAQDTQVATARHPVFCRWRPDRDML